MATGYDFRGLYSGLNSLQAQQNAVAKAEQQRRRLEQQNVQFLDNLDLREDQFQAQRDQFGQQQAFREKQFKDNQGRQNELLRLRQQQEGRAQTTFDQTQKQQRVAKFAGIAQYVQRADPTQKAMLWQKFIARFPKLAAGLQQAGIDPANVDLGTQFMIAQAGGAGGTQSKSGLPMFDQTTKTWNYVQGRDKGPPAVYPLAGAPGAYSPTVAARKTTAVETAKERQKAVRSLGTIESEFAQAMDVLSQVKNHPRLDAVTGNSSRLYTWRSETRDLELLIKQAKGGAFRRAVTAMRGLGALSDTEGKAATAAISRIAEGMSKPGFLKAVQELEDYYRKGLALAREKAGVAGPSTISVPSSGVQIPGFEGFTLKPKAK